MVSVLGDSSSDSHCRSSSTREERLGRAQATEQMVMAPVFQAWNEEFQGQGKSADPPLSRSFPTRDSPADGAGVFGRSCRSSKPKLANMPICSIKVEEFPKENSEAPGETNVFS